jgi:predicted ArsR family transcriptional regulator
MQSPTPPARASCAVSPRMGPPHSTSWPRPRTSIPTPRAPICEPWRAPAAAGERGRPRTIFSLRDGWALPDDGFRPLAELLAATLEGTDPDPRALRRLGVRWGRSSLTGRTPDDAQAELLRMLGRLGFDARIDGDRLDLGACPCPLISPNDPALVCKLVDAVVDGILEGSGGRIRARRRHHDPEQRSCSALLQLEAA